MRRAPLKTKQECKKQDDDKGRAEFLRNAHGGGDRGVTGNRSDRGRDRPRQGNDRSWAPSSNGWSTTTPSSNGWTSTSSSNGWTPTSSSSSYDWNRDALPHRRDAYRHSRDTPFQSGNSQREKRHGERIQPDWTQAQRQRERQLETQRQRRKQAQEDDQKKEPGAGNEGSNQGSNQRAPRHQGEESEQVHQQTEAQGACLMRPINEACSTPRRSTSFPSTSLQAPHYHHPCATTTSPMIIDDDVNVNDYVPASTILIDVYKKAEKNLHQEEADNEKSSSNSTRDYDTSSIMGGSEDRATIGEEDKASEEDSTRRRRSSVKRPIEAELTVTRTRPRVHSNNMGAIVMNPSVTGDSSSSTEPSPKLMTTDGELKRTNYPTVDPMVVSSTQRGTDVFDMRTNDEAATGVVPPVNGAPPCLKVMPSSSDTTTPGSVKTGAFKPPPPSRAGAGTFKPPPPRFKGPPPRMIPVPPKKAGVMPPNGESGIIPQRQSLCKSAPAGMITVAPKAVSNSAVVPQCPQSNNTAFLVEGSSSSNTIPTSIMTHDLRPRTSVLSRTGSHGIPSSTIPSTNHIPPYSMMGAANPLYNIPTSMRAEWNGMMMPEEESNRMLSMCMDVQPIQMPPQSVRREPYIRKIRDPYTLDRKKVQVLLHPNFSSVEERPLAGCSRVAVCGMFHSGNHPLRDYGLLFDEEVQPRRRSNKNRWEADIIFGDNRECTVWKHRVPETDWGIPRDVAVLCCMRDPLFFVPRVIKQPYSIREYDSKVTQENGLPRIKQVIEKATVDYEGRTFFHPLTMHAGDNTLSAKDRDHAIDFNNISDVYREYAQGFLSGKMCSGEPDDLKRFLIVRLEDVQKRPQEVVEALTRLGLKLLEPEKPFQALEKPAKTGCGTREQLIANSSIDKRYEAWTGSADLLETMREDISPAILDSLGYEAIDPKKAPCPEVKSSALARPKAPAPIFTPPSAPFAPPVGSLGAAPIDVPIGAPVCDASSAASIGAPVGAAPVDPLLPAVGSAPHVPPPVAPPPVSQASSSTSSNNNNLAS